MFLTGGDHGFTFLTGVDHGFTFVTVVYHGFTFVTGVDHNLLEQLCLKLLFATHFPRVIVQNVPGR